MQETPAVFGKNGIAIIKESHILLTYDNKKATIFFRNKRKGRKTAPFSGQNRIENAHFSTICGVLMPFKSAPAESGNSDIKPASPVIARVDGFFIRMHGCKMVANTNNWDT